MPDTTPPPPPTPTIGKSTGSQQPFDFAVWLAQLQGGAVNDRVSADMSRLVSECSLLEKKGGLKLQIVITPESGGLVVVADHTVTAPKPKPAGQFFYATPAGGLSRRDPTQPQLPTLEDPE